MFRPSKLIYALSLLLALSMLAVCGSVLAVSVPQTTEQLVKNSSDVIRGKVVSQQSQWDDPHQTIFTEVIIEISDVVIGSLEKARSVSVLIPGGEVGDTGLFVEHAPGFADGEDVVLFLTEVQDAYVVTSWEMGKFSVQGGNVSEKNVSVTDFIEEIKAVKR